MATGTAKAPRERLLDAANKLFYGEGIHTVGIDRVIETAGVAKASLYSAFGSKDELVRAYLLRRKELQGKRIDRALSAHSRPRAKMLAIFDMLIESTADPHFRGCAFLRASAEGLEKGAKSVCDASRARLRTMFTELAEAGGAKHPDRLGQQLLLLYDGVTVAAQMDRNATAAESAREVAASLFDAATKA